MFGFEIERWVPRYILKDKNGYAVAKAIEAAVQAANGIILQAVNCLYDYDSMPEWRLDELAWETNCPYDYTADIAIKRQWIRDAKARYRLYGTREGICQYMAGYFDDVTLQEAWEYGGQPFHFLVNFEGTWTPEKVSWATSAIGSVKNVRSILDLFRFVATMRRMLYAGCAMYSGETGTFQVAGVDMAGMNWYIDENEEMLLDENGVLLIVEG